VDREQSVRVGLVYNAFDPTNVVRDELLYQEGKPLQHYIEGLPDSCDWRIGLNGVPVEEADYSEIVPAADDLITVVVIPRGSGGSGKDILRLVALIAVVAIAAIVLGPSGLALTGTLYAIAFAATVAVGSFLINLALPPTAAKINKQSTDGQTYGYDGAKNTAKEGITLPVVYGQFRVAGNYVDAYSENVGDDQYLYGRCVLSDGEIDSVVGDPELNEQPIVDYKDIQWGYTNGALTEPVNTHFNYSKAQFFRQDKLTTAYTEYTTTGEVDAFEIDLLFPSGLANIKLSDGSKSNISVSVEIQYAPYGTTDWTHTGTIAGAAGHNTVFTGSSPVATNFAIVVQGVDTVGALNGVADYTLEYSPAGAGTWSTYETFSDISSSYATTTATTFYGGTHAYRIAAFDNDPVDVGGATYSTQFPQRTVNVTLPSGSYDFRVTGEGSIVSMTAASTAVAAGVVGDSSTTTVTYTDRRTVAIRKTYKSPTLTRGRYHVRFRRTTAEDTGHPDWITELHCVSVNEVQHSNVSLSSISTGWYIAKMTDQLSGIPNLTWLVKGVKVDIYDINGAVTATQWSDNPADIVLDMLIGEKRGALRDKLDIDWPAYVQWRQHCIDEDLKFNGVFDEMSSLWDALVQVYRVGRAMPVRVGTKLSVAIDKPTEPVMLFGPGNIFKDSFQIHYLPLVDRANEFEVSYYDKDDRNKRKTLRIADPDAAQAGQIPKTAEYDLFGVDNFEQAQKEIWYQLYNNRLARRVVTFDAPIESIALNIGDVALIQHDMVDWGVGGRVRSAASTTQVTLDKEVEIVSGETYSLLLIYDKIQRFTCSISNIAGNTYSLTGLTDTTFDIDTLKRLVTDTGDEAAILDYQFLGGTSAQVTLDRPVTGSTATVWDVDVIEERTVSTGAGVHTTVTVTSGFSATPTTYANYMIGINTSVKRPFRLRSLSGDGIDKRTLTFGEYNEFVYSPPETVIPAPTAKPPTYPNHVTGLNLSLDPIRTGTTVTAYLSWQVGDTLHYGGVDVYIAVNGGDFVFYNTVMNTTTMMLQLQEGVPVDIKVVAFNDRGYRANINTAPVISQLVTSVAGTLIQPTDLAWTLYRISFMASGSLSWVRGDPALGNVSPITRVQIQFNGTGAWVDQGITPEEILEVSNIPAGNHTARIRTETNTGQVSDWVTQAFSVVTPTLVAPTFLTDGTAVDHDLNTDSSCNLNVEWQWSGSEDEIDGFQIISHQGTTNAAYTIGTTPTSETLSSVSPDKRIMWYYGVPCDKWYTVYVRAFKYVHPSFDASGIIYSTANKPTLAGENPYQPDSNVAFGGDVTGTIGGTPVADVLAAMGSGDTTPPSTPTGLALSSSIETDSFGVQWFKLLADWDANSEPDLSAYVLAIKETTGGDYVEFTVTSSVTSFFWSVQPSTSYTVKIKALDHNNNASAYSSTVAHTTIADTVPPSAPTSLSGIAAITSIFLSWTNPADTDIASIKIYENTVNDSSTATNIATVLATPSSQGRFTRSGLATGDTRYYWVKAVDRSGNQSAFSTGTNVTTAQVGTTDIAANSITAALIAAGTITADRIAAGTITGDRFDTGTSMPGTITVGLTGVSIGTIQTQANDPAARINAYTTLIQPGLIQISGGTTLSDWRQGGDLTKIAGGSISANTISANKVEIGLRGIDFAGLEFSANSPTLNRVYWSAGTITYINDSGAPATVSITASSVLWTASILYIYWVKGATVLSTTTTPATAYGANNIVLATYSGGTDLVANYGRTIIDGSHIITGTIDADRVKAGTVLADTVLIGTLPLGNVRAWSSGLDATYIDGGKIYANSITASQITTGSFLSTSAQIGDLTVTTIKIAGQSVISPSVTEGTDVTLVSTTAADVVESSLVTVGDATDGKALVTIYGWMDFTGQADAGAAIDLYTNVNSAGYVLKKTIKVGVRTSGGTTYSYVPFSFSFTVNSIQTIRVKMKGREIVMPFSSAFTSVVRDPTIVIQGAAR
jgi:hypothetical protein